LLTDKHHLAVEVPRQWRFDGRRAEACESGAVTPKHMTSFRARTKADRRRDTFSTSPIFEKHDCVRRPSSTSDFAFLDMFTTIPVREDVAAGQWRMLPGVGV
jgi:hypothetical protein